MMPVPTILWLFWTLLCGVSQVYAVAPTDLRLSAPLTGPVTPNVPVRVPLPRQVIAATANSFADLRLFDDQRGETPYVIYPQSAPPLSTFAFQVLSYSQSEGEETVVLQRPQNTGAFREILVYTRARDFHKAVRLQASHDRHTWVDVTTDTLFDFSARIDIRKTTIEFPETDAPYVRLLFQDATPLKPWEPGMRIQYEGLDFTVPGKPSSTFRIDQIIGRGGKEHAEVYDRAVFPSSDTHTDAMGNTLVRLGQVNLPVALLTLTVDNPYYHRQVELWAADTDGEEAYQRVASGVVYKLPGVQTADNTLRLHPPQQPYLRLKILNGDNPPLRLQQVEVAWVRQNLYFIPEAARRYTLYFGAEQMRPPAYELQRLLPADYTRLTHYAVWSIGDVQPNPDYYPRRPENRRGRTEKILLTTVVLVLACGMGWWVYRLLKRLPAQPRA